MKNVARHALAVALITASWGQELSDSLSASIEKAQALDKEARQVCQAKPIQINWVSAKQDVRSAEQWEMKPSRVVSLIPTSVTFVRQVLVSDIAVCGAQHQALTLKMLHASWDLDHAEQKLLEKRLLNTLLMDEIQAK